MLNSNKTRNIRIKVKLRGAREIIVAVQSGTCYVSECVLTAIAARHARHMRRIVLPSVAFLALPYFFFALSLKRRDFRRKFIERKTACFESSASFV
jgi:hypothetical protein